MKINYLEDKAVVDSDVTMGYQLYTVPGYDEQGNLLLACGLSSTKDQGPEKKILNDEIKKIYNDFPNLMKKIVKKLRVTYPETKFDFGKVHFNLENEKATLSTRDQHKPAEIEVCTLDVSGSQDAVLLFIELLEETKYIAKAHATTHLKNIAKRLKTIKSLPQSQTKPATIQSIDTGLLVCGTLLTILGITLVSTAKKDDKLKNALGLFFASAGGVAIITTALNVKKDNEKKLDHSLTNAPQAHFSNGGDEEGSSRRDIKTSVKPAQLNSP
jgi:hypothetical protein